MYEGTPRNEKLEPRRFDNLDLTAESIENSITVLEAEVGDLETADVGIAYTLAQELLKDIGSVKSKIAMLDRHPMVHDKDPESKSISLKQRLDVMENKITSAIQQ